jgi:hypothetical protein
MRRREETEAALIKIREIAKSEPGPDWSESEWKKIMASAVVQKFEGKRAKPRLGLKPALAYGFVSAVILVVAGLILRNATLKHKASPFGPSPALVHKSSPVKLPSPTEPTEKKKDNEVRSDDRPIVVARAPKTLEPEIRPEEPAAAGTEGSQDVVSVTLVSQDTGLRITWILDKKFEWKGGSR